MYVTNELFDLNQFNDDNIKIITNYDHGDTTVQMIKSCYSIIVKLSDQPWWILISHEHGRKQICALLIMKTINNKHRPVSLYRKCLKYLWQKKKLTRVHSSHLGHECIIWGHFMKKGAIYLLLLFMFISNWFLFQNSKQYIG